MAKSKGRKANGQIKKGYRMTDSGRVVKAKAKTKSKGKR